uniref:Pre-mRNA-splicing factor SYF2 n=1 Tax=Globodera pallida TaxID=36090 RepID=A0A183CCX4_GLOPA
MESLHPSTSSSASAIECSFSVQERRRRQNVLLAKLKKRAKTDVSSASNSSSTAVLNVGPVQCAAKIASDCEGGDEDVQLVEEEDEQKRHEELRRKAAEMLIREAKRSAQRADLYGPQGWIKPRALSTNKVFLARTLQSAELQRRDYERTLPMKRRKM